MANLVDRLCVRSIHQLRYQHVIKLHRILYLLELLLLLLLVLVHPEDPWRPFFDYVHLVVSAVIGLVMPGLDPVAYTTLLAVVQTIQVLATLGELIFEAGVKALVEVVVLGVATQDGALLPHVQHLTH